MVLGRLAVRTGRRGGGVRTLRMRTVRKKRSLAEMVRTRSLSETVAVVAVTVCLFVGQAKAVENVQALSHPADDNDLDSSHSSPRQKREESDVQLSRRTGVTGDLDDPEPALSREKRLTADAANYAEQVQLSRDKRADDTAELAHLREKRVGVDTSDPEQVPSRLKRAGGPESSLLPEGFVSVDGGQALSRQKRVSAELKDLDSVQLREEGRLGDEPETSELLLSRQKRVDEDPENIEPSLVEEKGVDEDRETTFSRQRRFSVEVEKSGQDPARQERLREDIVVSRQKRLSEGLEDSEVAFATGKWVSLQEELSQPSLSRQKRRNEDPEQAAAREPSLSRQKRTGQDLEESGTALVTEKRLTEDTSPTLSRQKRVSAELRNSEPVLSSGTQLKEVPDFAEPVLSRQKRVVRDVEDAGAAGNADHLLSRLGRSDEGGGELSGQRSLEKADVQNPSSTNFVAISRQKRQLLAFQDDRSSEDSEESYLSKKVAALVERRRHEPEHKLYNEDLLIRRLRAIRMENMMGNKEQQIDIEKEDSWEQELRIRRELAEKAIEYGIQKRKERLKNPQPQDMSILQRIKQDAEEILRRREEEVQYVNRFKQEKPYPALDLASADKEDVSGGNAGSAVNPDITVENVRHEDVPEKIDQKKTAGEQEKEKKKEKKKTEQAIRKLLNLKPLPEKRRASPGKPGPAGTLGIDGSPTGDNSDRSVLWFESLFSKRKGKLSKKKRKKMKRQQKALERSKGRKNRDGLLKRLHLSTFGPFTG